MICSPSLGSEALLHVQIPCKEHYFIYRIAKEEKEKREKKSKPVSKTPNETKKPTSTTTPGNKRKTPSGSEEKTAVTKENKTSKKPDKRNGFEKGLIAEEIIGAVENNGDTHFLIKWK